MVGNGANKTSTNKHQYKIHPIANIFPMMSPSEFEALKADIKEHGLRESIVFWKNMLVDGRNRLKACEELGIEPGECELMEDTDPVAYVLSHNLYRRHLNESQRGMVAAKLAKLKIGDVASQRGVSIDTASIDEASKQLNVGRATTARAKKVIAEGSEQLQQAVEQGSLPVSVASELVKAVPDKDQQTEIVSKGADAVRQAVKEKPLAQKRLTKQQAAEKRKQASAPVEATATASPGLAQLRTAWAKASHEEREAFIKEIKQ